MMSDSKRFTGLINSIKSQETPHYRANAIWRCFDSSFTDDERFDFIAHLCRNNQALLLEAVVNLNVDKVNELLTFIQNNHFQAYKDIICKLCESNQALLFRLISNLNTGEVNAILIALQRNDGPSFDHFMNYLIDQIFQNSDNPFQTFVGIIDGTIEDDCGACLLVTMLNIRVFGDRESDIILEKSRLILRHLYCFQRENFITILEETVKIAVANTTKKKGLFRNRSTNEFIFFIVMSRLINLLVLPDNVVEAIKKTLSSDDSDENKITLCLQMIIASLSNHFDTVLAANDSNVDLLRAMFATTGDIATSKAILASLMLRFFPSVYKKLGINYGDKTVGVALCAKLKKITNSRDAENNDSDYSLYHNFINDFFTKLVCPNRQLDHYEHKESKSKSQVSNNRDETSLTMFHDHKRPQARSDRESGDMKAHDKKITQASLASVTATLFSEKKCSTPRQQPTKAKPSSGTTEKATRVLDGIVSVVPLVATFRNLLTSRR